MKKEFHSAKTSQTIVDVFFNNLWSLIPEERDDFICNHGHLCRSALEQLLKFLDFFDADAPVQEKEGDILIYDDNTAFAGLLKALLSSNGHASKVVRSVGELNQYLDKHNGQLCLLLDIVIGDISGADLAVSLKETYPVLKIILISGDVATPAVENLIATGVVSKYLAKPFTYEELKTVL